MAVTTAGNDHEEHWAQATNALTDKVLEGVRRECWLESGTLRGLEEESERKSNTLEERLRRRISSKES